MVYDPEPKSASVGTHEPEAGQPLTEAKPALAKANTAAAEDRNARRREQRAAARTAKSHRASTGRDLDYSGNDQTEQPRG